MKKRVVVKFDKCIGCRSCEVACAREHSQKLRIEERITADTNKPVSRIAIKPTFSDPTECEELKPIKGQSRNDIKTGKAYPIRCRHCDDPKCVEACMSGALMKNDEGVVVHNPDKCVGCWMCIMACPFGAIKRDVKNKIIVKCDLCPHRETPACVEACKTGAIIFLREEEIPEWGE